MNDNIIKIKRALISVFDKTDIVKLAKSLEELGIEIVSTGGTARLLVDNNIEVTQIDEITKFPEVLGGRVKTLHPNIYAGLLSRLNNSDDKETIKEFNIEEFDLVVVNLYPFQKLQISYYLHSQGYIENLYHWTLIVFVNSLQMGLIQPPE